ncbi:lymphoid-specific helicase [Holotrichia oblita]|uniref:Lymphoid-specific helicase n=1 Tax=Holotrichia oblita TaxID=644536 RepID=A0ACB9TMZ7_HOLOL|nr:lymphoid-specific helicase [Holotrichia oblita]
MDNNELRDMLQVFFECNKNRLEAVRRYGVRFPDREIPDSKIFQRIETNLKNYGSFKKPKTQKRKFSEDKELDVLLAVQENSQTSTREIAHNIGVSKTTVHGILRKHKLKPYVARKRLFEHGVNGILADEMGLGKTVQVIALICNLIREIRGPFLIVVPLSTLPNWMREFERFAPEIPVVKYHGDRQTRFELMRNILKTYRVGENDCRPVVITTLHMVFSETNFFKKITWKYLILDEGHCLKNIESRTSRTMRELKCLNKLILTGTPLQNNLRELWALLNFIMPNIFKNMNTFSSLFLIEDFDDNSKIVKEEKNNNVISSLHKIIQPFMLRRLKADVLKDLVPKKEVTVYCPLTNLQRTLYMYAIKKDVVALQRIKDENEEEEPIYEGRPKRKCVTRKTYTESNIDDSFTDYEEAEKILGVKLELDKADGLQYFRQIKMTNPVMLFRRIVNHPYLVHMPLTPQKTVRVDENLVTESGKMLVLDIMLKKLKERNHKVLIFSTFVIMLDLIEEYMIMRNYTYSRIDGSRNLIDRDENVTRFNSDPDTFAFLISTRAGGLGLNLVAADTVIIYDRDWNPQVDTQAQDRCHRIGQTKPVMVYSLITKNTIDDRILNYSNMKKKLEVAVIKGGKYTNSTEIDEKPDLQELLSVLENDNSKLVIHENGNIFSDEEWDKLLDRSEIYKQMERKSLES